MSCGGVNVVQWYTSALADNLVRSFKEDTAKAALQAAWTTGVVRIQSATNKKGESKYGSLDIENGDLVLSVYQLANVGDGMSGLLDKLGDSSTGLSVKSSQNLKEHEEQRNEALAKMQEYVGLTADVTLDVDYPAWSKKVDTEGYKDRLGEVIQWFVDAIKDRLQRLKDDDLAKAALQAEWTTGVIRLELGTNKKGEYKYQECMPRDGDLAVIVYQMANVSDTGSDLIGRLGDPASGLPLKSAQNIKEHDEKKEENLKKIQESVGLSTEVTLDIDWSAIDAQTTKQGYTNRVGEVVIDWVVGSLASNLERICKEEMTKEAIAETWTTGVIRMEENKKISYHAVEFVNGDLVVQYKPENLCSNVGEIGRDIESKL